MRCAAVLTPRSKRWAMPILCQFLTSRETLRTFSQPTRCSVISMETWPPNSLYSSISSEVAWWLCTLKDTCLSWSKLILSQTWVVSVSPNLVTVTMRHRWRRLPFTTQWNKNLRSTHLQFWVKSSGSQMVPAMPTMPSSLLKLMLLAKTRESTVSL